MWYIHIRCSINERAKIAVDNLKYQVAGYIAKYAAAMNGADYIIFTGGIGENQAYSS